MWEGVGRKLPSDPAAGIILNSREISHRTGDALVGRLTDLEALLARQSRGREEERRRVAAQLNGPVSQSLSGLSLQAAHLPLPATATGLMETFHECVTTLGQELQRLAGNLYPALLDHFGLGVALRDYCSEFSRKRGIPVSYAHRGVPSRLPVHTAAVLYRIVEESLRNADKHARAQQVWVTLSRRADGIRLSIRDNGDGFDPAAIETGKGLGILEMRVGLRGIHGSLAIRSRPSEGTEIVAQVPLLTAGNQPGAAVASNVIVNPLNQHQQPVIELDNIHEVHE